VVTQGTLTTIKALVFFENKLEFVKYQKANLDGNRDKPALNAKIVEDTTTQLLLV
jgi:hypothetical protein